MKSTPQYLRIGTSYYKTVKKPLASGDFMETLQAWPAEFIKQDHGRSFLSTIEKFDGFCLIPCHLNYKRTIGAYYNKYAPFSHVAKPGEPVQILAYLKHIFGEQLEVGLDYLKILSTYVAHLGSSKDFFPRLEYEIEGLKNLAIVSEGAKWIWNWAEDLYPNSTQILDYFQQGTLVRVCKGLYQR